MIEHLSRLDPGTSPMLGEMQTLRRKSAKERAIEKNARRMACPECNGRKKIKYSDDEAEWCHRCGGSGTRQAGHGVNTRSKKIASLDAAAVSFLVAGMPPQWYDAAWLTVTGCTAAKARLDDELINYRMPEVTGEWTDVEGDELIEKTILLSTMATWHLAKPRAMEKEIIKYKYLGVGKTAWFTKWRHRYRYPREVLLGYVDLADEYMRLRYSSWPDVA